MTPADLKLWRQRNSFTLEQLARVLGLTLSTVWRWESGASKVPPWLEGYLRLIEEDITRQGKGEGR